MISHGQLKTDERDLVFILLVRNTRRDIYESKNCCRSNMQFI